LHLVDQDGDTDLVLVGGGADGFGEIDEVELQVAAGMGWV
jgi:hypothetical protein